MDKAAGTENKVVVLQESYLLAKAPANKLPKKLAINHTPMNKDINLAGANLVTIDKPTGDKQSSPMVQNKYTKINQITLTGLP